MNQTQNGSQWNLLGTFTLDPAFNPTVELSNQANGTVMVDAIRFVSAGTRAPGLLYVHTDHLGSPQKMTDANQALVWDGRNAIGTRRQPNI